MLENKPEILNIRDTCTGCGACMNICAHQAISLKYDDEGFLMPFVDSTKCIHCGICDKICHVIHPLNSNEDKQTQYYMGWYKDDNVRESSSSGGAFTLLSENILSKGGIVFASRYNFDKERLEFSDTDHFPLREFRKSKYIESNTQNVFRLVRENVRKGRDVLFCGTPCQVSAMRSFFHDKVPDNLLLVDFFCHGVPSNYNFTLYLHQFGENHKITGLDFRYKNFSQGNCWHNLNMMFEIDGKKKVVPYSYSSFLQAFHDNRLLRKCCYTCDLINRRLSDLTIADYWGIIYDDKTLDDNKGISLFCLHTDKAKKVFSEIKEKSYVRTLTSDKLDYALKNRNQEEYSLNQRALDVQYIENEGFLKFLDKNYGKQIMIRKIKDQIKWMLKRK